MKLFNMEATTYYPRTISTRLQYMSAHFPCVLLLGARQVGKSTILEEILPEGMHYVTLDNYVEAEKANQDPIGFLEEHPAPLFIDEVQYAPALMRAIKMKVDASKQNGMYWMTGSQQFHLMQGISESLAGRVGILDLYTFSQREILNAGNNAPIFQPEEPAKYAEGITPCNIHELYRRIWRGGYPILHKDEGMEPNVYFDSYVRSFLERDVRHLTQVSNLASFMKFLRSAALRTGQQIVYSELARDAEITPNTAKAWLSILETTGIISILHPYSVNSIKRLTKTPKLYFMDTGLCCWLAQWDNPTALMNSAYSGAILETWVYGQLLRSFSHNGKRPQLYFFRDAKGTAEVDFLLIQNGGIYPIEVKRSSSPAESDLKHVAKIPTNRLELRPGIIMCTTDRIYSLPNGIYAFPISLL